MLGSDSVRPLPLVSRPSWRRRACRTLAVLRVGLPRFPCHGGMNKSVHSFRVEESVPPTQVAITSQYDTSPYLWVVGPVLGISLGGACVRSSVPSDRSTGTPPTVFLQSLLTATQSSLLSRLARRIECRAHARAYNPSRFLPLTLTFVYAALCLSIAFTLHRAGEVTLA